MDLQPLNLLAIAGMAIVTLATRFAGYWMVRRFTVSPRVGAALESVPPAILAAVVAPAVLAEGVPEALAGVAVVLLALRAPGLVAIVAGVALVVALRQAGL